MLHPLPEPPLLLLTPPLAPLPLPPERVCVSGLLPHFCGVGIEWRSAGDPHWGHMVSPVELEALGAVPGVRALNAQTRPDASAEQLDWLLRRPGLRGLADLRCTAGQLDDAATQTLAQRCPRLSTLALTGLSGSAVPPLHWLPALTDLLLKGRCAVGATLAQLAGCAELRRLTVFVDSPHLQAAVPLSPALRPAEFPRLTTLRLRFVNGLGPALAAQTDWGALFASLPALQSLCLTRSHAAQATAKLACSAASCSHRAAGAAARRGCRAAAGL
jgi:hypothetical protein